MATIIKLTENTGFKAEAEVIKDTDLFVTWDFEGDRPLFHTINGENGEQQSVQIIAHPGDPLSALEARSLGIDVEDLYQRGILLRYDADKRQVQDRIVGRPVARVSDATQKGFDTKHPAVVSASTPNMEMLPVTGAIAGPGDIQAPASMAGAVKVAATGADVPAGNMANLATPPAASTVGALTLPN